MARHCLRHNGEQNQVPALTARDTLREWGGKVKNTTILAERPLSSDQLHSLPLLSLLAIWAVHLTEVRNQVCWAQLPGEARSQKTC